MKLYIDYDFLHKWNEQDNELRKRIFGGLLKLSKYHNLSHAAGMKPHFLLGEGMSPRIQNKLVIGFTRNLRFICDVLHTTSRDLKDIKAILVEDFGDYHGKVRKSKLVKKVL